MSEKKKYQIDAEYFPGWLKKSVTFSIDDGNLEMDRKFKEIVKPVKIKGTFNLGSHTMGDLSPEEYREFYKGYGIANHCKYHPFAFEDGVTYDIAEEPFCEKTADPGKLYPTGEHEGLYWMHLPRGWRRIADTRAYKELVKEGQEELEAVFGKDQVVGYVWPFFRQNNAEVIAYLSEMGYRSVRGVDWPHSEEPRDYEVPANRMDWKYTAADDNLLDRWEEYVELPEESGNMKFFCVGVHSIDFETHGKWRALMDFAQSAKDKSVYYTAPVDEIFERVDAQRSIVIEEDGVVNPSEKYPVYLVINHKQIKIEPGEKYLFAY